MGLIIPGTAIPTDNRRQGIRRIVDVSDSEAIRAADHVYGIKIFMGAKRCGPRAAIPLGDKAGEVIASRAANQVTAYHPCFVGDCIYGLER
jgi:hypothetical protein